MRLIYHLFLEIDILHLLAYIHVLLHIFLTLLLEKVLLLRWVDLTVVLKFVKVAFFPFVKTHVILVPEMIEYSLGFEVNPDRLLLLHVLLNLLYQLSIFFAEEHISVVGLVLQRVETNFLWHFFTYSFVGNAIFEDLCEIHVIVR